MHTHLLMEKELKFNMYVYISSCPIGSFAFDENGKLIDLILFKKNYKIVSERILKLERGETIEEERELKKRVVKKGYIPKLIKANKTLQKNFRKLAIKLNFVSDEMELNNFLSNVGMNIIRFKLSKRDGEKIIIQIIGLIDELNKNLNIYSEKVREWYGLYDPDASKTIKSNKEFLTAIISGKRKSKFGMSFTEDDKNILSTISKSVLELWKAKEMLEKYNERITKKEMPNLTALAGPFISARLLSLAGGLENLAKMHASKIQLLGAEKALFRHLKKGAKAPKHGVIFTHPLIQNAPKRVRGKIARIIASKLSLAVKIDYFSKENRSEKIKKELENEIEKLVGKSKLSL